MPGIVPKGQARQRHGHTTESRGGQIEGTTLFSKKSVLESLFATKLEVSSTRQLSQASTTCKHVSASLGCAMKAKHGMATATHADMPVARAETPSR
jgi:hypothetical protein